MSSRRPFCSDVSLDNGESLGATASRIDHWLIVEYRGLWGPDALRASGLSDQVKHSLREQVNARPRTRLLFVRRPDRRGRDELRGYAATSREGEETCAARPSRRTRTSATSTSRRRASRSTDRSSSSARTASTTPAAHAVVARSSMRSPSRSKRRPFGRRRTSAATGSPATSSVSRAACTTDASSARTRAACSTRTSARRSTSSTTAAGRVTRSPPRRSNATSVSARVCCASTTSVSSRSKAPEIAFEDRDGRVHEREVSLMLGPEDYLTCHASELHRARRYVVSG